MIPSWRQRHTRSYFTDHTSHSRTSSVRNTEKRNSSLPPPSHTTSSNINQETENKKPSHRSTIWSFGTSNLTNDNEEKNNSDNSVGSNKENIGEDDSQQKQKLYSFVPKTETKPEASSPEIIKIDSNGSSSERQSRSRTRNSDKNNSVKSRTASAFQQLWPQTYNSFQNRAVRLHQSILITFISFLHFRN